MNRNEGLGQGHHAARGQATGQGVRRLAWLLALSLCAVLLPWLLHARSAAKIAEVAQNAKHKVWITRDDESVDAASIIDLLTLGCIKGTEIVVGIENPADQPILNQIVDLVEAGFGE